MASHNKSVLWITISPQTDNSEIIKIRSKQLKVVHDKTSKMVVYPTKARISLCIRPFRSESSLAADMNHE